MALLRIEGLPDDALAAATVFYAEWAGRVVPGDDCTLLFHPADHTHRAWRLAAVQGLARLLVPKRVNAIASDDEAAIAATLAYVAGAAGVTGQVLCLDSDGAGSVV